VSERPKPVALYVLAAFVLLEGVILAAATIYLVVEIFIGDPSFLATAVAYAVTAAILSTLVLVVGRAVLRARPWVRGAVACVAILQLLVSYSIIITKEPTLGWVLAVPGAVMLVLLFTRPVLRATARPVRNDDEDERTF
jgi:hypothetical protein